MVKVIFYNLIRSKYRIEDLEVEAGSLQEVIKQVIKKHPHIDKDDLLQAVLFINQEKVMHVNRLDEKVEDGDHVVFTNFVGGG